jgi:CBS domain-containing protein
MTTQSGMNVTLGALAAPIVVTATPEITTTRAAQLMRAHHVGSLVVVDAASGAGTPIGIVTDRDLVLAVMAEELDPKVFTVGDVMTTQLVTAPVDATLHDAVALMRQRRVRRLVVVDAAGRVVGIATLEDILEGMAREFSELALALRDTRDRERKERA